MSNEVEGLVQLRRRLLRNTLIGYPIALVAEILHEVLPKDGHHGWTGLMELAGWAIFGIAMWKITRVQKILRANSYLAKALSDELWWANRYRAAFFAFMVLFLSQGVFAAIFGFYPHLMTLSAYVDLNLITGYVAFIGAFLHLDQAN